MFRNCAFFKYLGNKTLTFTDLLLTYNLKMRKAIYSSLVAAIMLVSVALGQSRQDVVYLKNGSILKGKVLTQADEPKQKIELQGGSVLVYDKSEIDRIEINVSQKHGTKRNVTVNGFYHNSYCGLLLGSEDYYPLVGAQFETINGYKFNSFTQIAVGVGINLFGNGNAPITPVFLQIGGDMLKNKSITPVYYIEGGYGFAPLQQSNGFTTYKGGNLFGIGTGLRFYSSAKVSFTVGLGYRYQKTQSTTKYDWWPNGEYIEIRDITYNRTSIKLGFSF